MCALKCQRACRKGSNVGLDTASSLGHLIAASQKAKKPRTKPSAISEASKRGRLLGRGPDRG